MITVFSNRIANLLLSNGYLTAAEESEIIYGLFTILSRLIFAIECVLLGALFKNPIESIVFYISFLFIKKYAGGYHSATEGRCFIISTVSILLSIWCISVSQKSNALTSMIYLFSICGGVAISIFSPVATNEIPFSKDKKRKYRLFSCFRVVMLLIASSILLVFSILNYCVTISVSIIIETTFLIMGHIKQKSKNYSII